MQSGVESAERSKEWRAQSKHTKRDRASTHRTEINSTHGCMHRAHRMNNPKKTDRARESQRRMGSTRKQTRHRHRQRAEKDRENVVGPDRNKVSVTNVHAWMQSTCRRNDAASTTARTQTFSHAYIHAVIIPGRAMEGRGQLT